MLAGLKFSRSDIGYGGEPLLGASLSCAAGCLFAAVGLFYASLSVWVARFLKKPVTPA